MEQGLKPLHGVQFYSFGGTEFWCNCLYSELYNKKYIRIYKSSTYTNKDKETKESQSWVNLTIPAAEALFQILGQAIENAKQAKGVLYIFT